jgi:hypothetical protein
MALKHILKLTETEAVLKCYITDSAGGNVDISLADDLTATGQTFSNVNVEVTISELYWGLKAGKQLDVTRIVTPANDQVHGHYYLVNAGQYQFQGFVDDVYGSKDIRMVFDGPGHCIIKLRKTSGWV